MATVLMVIPVATATRVILGERAVEVAEKMMIVEREETRGEKTAVTEVVEVKVEMGEGVTMGRGKNPAVMIGISAHNGGRKGRKGRKGKRGRRGILLNKVRIRERKCLRK